MELLPQDTPFRSIDDIGIRLPVSLPVAEPDMQALPRISPA